MERTLPSFRWNTCATYLSIVAHATILMRHQDERIMEQKESIGGLISAIHRHICIYLDAELKKHKIGSSQIPFLRALQNEDGVNQEKLTTMFKVNKATTTRAIDRLVEEEYAVRKKDPADNRAYKIYLTDKGRKIGPEMKKVLQQLTSTLSSDFTEGEKKFAIILLEKMAQNILTANEKKEKLPNE